MNLSKPLAAAALAFGACAAQAHADVHWNISIGLPFPGQVVVASPPPPPPPPPVVVTPYPVYGPPPAVYGPPVAVYGRPVAVYGPPAPVYYRPHHHRHWDSDRDGIPDRYDRRPYNPRW